MIKLSYNDELGRLIQFDVNDWEAVHLVADKLLEAPIDLDYLNYLDGNQTGIFNLNNFCKQ